MYTTNREYTASGTAFAFVRPQFALSEEQVSHRLCLELSPYTCYILRLAGDMTCASLQVEVTLTEAAHSSKSVPHPPRFSYAL